MGAAVPAQAVTGVVIQNEQRLCTLPLVAPGIAGSIGQLEWRSDDPGFGLILLAASAPAFAIALKVGKGGLIR